MRRTPTVALGIDGMPAARRRAQSIQVLGQFPGQVIDEVLDQVLGHPAGGLFTSGTRLRLSPASIDHTGGR